jgi:hypothetical protein
MLNRLVGLALTPLGLLLVAFSSASVSPQDDFLGRTGDKRWGVYGNISYGDFNKWRVTAFGDYESIKYDAKDKYGRSLGIISWFNPLMKKEVLNEDLVAAGQATKV